MEQKNVKLWNKDFALIIIMNFFVFLSHLMLMSTFPFYILSLGGSMATAGAASALFSIVAVICRPFVGWMLNNGKRRSLLIIGMCGMILMPLGYLFFSMLVLAIIFRMIHGASFATTSTTNSTITADILPKPRFAEGMGVYGMSTALATAAGPALGLALYNNVGFKALFGVAAGSVVITFILFFFLRNPKIEVEHSKFSLKMLINKDAVPASLTALVFLMSFGAVDNFLAKFASDSGLPGGGIYFVLVAVMLFITRVLLGRIADTKGEGPFVYTGTVTMFLGLLILALMPNNVTFVLSALLVGYGFGGLEPALQSMAVRIAPPQLRGSANATFFCAYDIGIGIGGGLAGVLIDALGYKTMFIIIGCTSLVALLIYALWARNHASAFRFASKTY